MAEAGGSIAGIGEALEMCARQLFHWWHRVRDGTLQRSSFSVYVTQLRLEVRALLQEGMSCDDPKGAALCSRSCARFVSWQVTRAYAVRPRGITNR